MCIDFKILEVKVPIIFSGTKGFPLRRDGHYRYFFSARWVSRYAGIDVNLLILANTLGRETYLSHFILGFPLQEDHGDSLM